MRIRSMHIAFLIVAFCCVSGVSAQVFPARYEAGINGGAFVYQGDLAPRVWGSLKTTRPGFGVYMSRIISESFTAGVVVNIASLKGDETKYDIPAFRKFRAFKFTSSLREAYVQIKWHLEPITPFDLPVKPYVFAGFGIAFINTSADYTDFEAGYFGSTSSTVTGLAIDITKPAKKTKPVLPVGFGIRYFLSEDLSLNFESSYRVTSTDYIDGFSEAANPDMNDHYLVQTVGVGYRFGRKSKYSCPVVGL